MLANRISHGFDFQGPSFKVDTACSSSFVALEQAISAIGAGKCDAAIVAASVAYFNPEIIENLVKLGAVSPEGLSQVFDNKGKTMKKILYKIVKSFLNQMDFYSKRFRSK